MRTGHNNVTRHAQGQKVPQERQLFTAEENIYNVTSYFKHFVENHLFIFDLVGEIDTIICHMTFFILKYINI